MPKSEFVYFLHSDFGIKIGKSKDPDRRASVISILMPFKITKKEIYQVNNMDIAEKYLLKYFAGYRLNGEWFNLSEEQMKKARSILNEQYKVTDKLLVFKEKPKYTSFRIDNIVYEEILKHRKGRYSHMSIPGFIIHMARIGIRKDKRK